MDQVVFSFERAREFFSESSLSPTGVIGGALFTLVILQAARLFLRAIILSWLGNRNGAFVSGIMEFVLSVILVTFTYRNPGTVLAVLGWNAFLFTQLIVAFMR